MITEARTANGTAASIAETISIEPRGKSPNGDAHFVTITIAGAITFAAAIKCTDHGCRVMLPYSRSGHGWTTQYQSMHFAGHPYDDVQTNYITIPSGVMQRAITAKACEYLLGHELQWREMVESQRYAVLFEHPKEITNSTPNAQRAAHLTKGKGSSRGAA